MAAGRRDDTVDADEDRVDEQHERVEAARDEGAATERLDVADAVEDVPLQGPSSSSIPRRLQAHRLGSGRGVDVGQNRAG